MAEQNTHPTPIAEIQMGPSKFEAFMDQHQKKLIGLAILVLFAVLGVVTWQTLKQQKQQDAGSATLSATDEGTYKAVITDFPNSASAATAQLLLAKIEAEEDPAKALESLQAFVTTHYEHPAHASALTVLGQLQYQSGKTDQAKSTLLEVTQLDESADYIKHVAYITLGDIENAGGNIDTAKSHYEQAKSFDAGKQLAEYKLKILGVDPPELLEPAPLEPAQPTTQPLNPTQNGSLPQAPPTPETSTISPPNPADSASENNSGDSNDSNDSATKASTDEPAQEETPQENSEISEPKEETN